MCLQLFVMIICPLIAHSVALAHVQSCLAVHDANPGMAAEGPPAASSFPPVNSYQLLSMNTWKWSRWRMHLSPHKGLQDQASFPRFQKSQNMWKSLTTLTTGSTNHVLIIPTQELVALWAVFQLSTRSTRPTHHVRQWLASRQTALVHLICWQMPKHSSLKNGMRYHCFWSGRSSSLSLYYLIYPILGVHNFVMPCILWSCWSPLPQLRRINIARRAPKRVKDLKFFWNVTAL